MWFEIEIPTSPLHSCSFIHPLAMLFKTIAAISVIAPAIRAQAQPIHVQNNTWNSSFNLSPSQIAAANLSSTTLKSRRTSNAQIGPPGPSLRTIFTILPPVNTSTLPGTLLVVEKSWTQISTHWPTVLPYLGYCLSRKHSMAPPYQHQHTSCGHGKQKHSTIHHSTYPACQS
jgi:hypothetical protein